MSRYLAEVTIIAFAVLEGFAILSHEDGQFFALIVGCICLAAGLVSKDAIQAAIDAYIGCKTQPTTTVSGGTTTTTTGKDDNGATTTTTKTA